MSPSDGETFPCLDVDPRASRCERGGPNALLFYPVMTVKKIRLCCIRDGTVSTPCDEPGSNEGALQNFENSEEKEKLSFFLDQLRLICGSSWEKGTG